MDDKLGKAGRFYSLTPKAVVFVEALEEWCAERGIGKEDISKLLRHAAVREHGDFLVEEVSEIVESLVEKGYLEEEEAEAVDKHLITECSAQEFRDYMRENGSPIDFISDRTLDAEDRKFRHKIRRAFLLDLRAKKAAEV